MIIEFTEEEVKTIFDLIDSLSGGNPEYSFAWDGSDTMETPFSENF
jgi:hypothetical protein